MLKATQAGDLTLCKTLIDNEADVNVVDDNGDTPLDYVISSKHPDLYNDLKGWSDATP